MSLGTILLIILAIALLGGGPFYGTGYLRRQNSASYSLSC